MDKLVPIYKDSTLGSDTISSRTASVEKAGYAETL